MYQEEGYAKVWGKYAEFQGGVYDACNKCQGMPVRKCIKDKGKFYYLVECTICGECVGYEDSWGAIMVAWNKEQRNDNSTR